MGEGRRPGCTLGRRSYTVPNGNGSGPRCSVRGLGVASMPDFRSLLEAVISSTDAVQRRDVGAADRLGDALSALIEAMRSHLGSADALLEFDRRLANQIDFRPAGLAERTSAPIYYF